MIDRLMLKNFRKDFDVSVKVLETKYGIKLSIGNIKYSSHQFNTKIIGNVVSADDPTGEKTSWDSLCGRYNLRKDDYKAEIKIRGQVFILCGIKERRSKYPIIGTDKFSQRRYKLSIKDVLEALTDIHKIKKLQEILS